MYSFAFRKYPRARISSQSEVDVLIKEVIEVFCGCMWVVLFNDQLYMLGVVVIETNEYFLGAEKFSFWGDANHGDQIIAYSVYTIPVPK